MRGLVDNTVPAVADVVIVGGGFAGAATACFLARRGVRDVVLLEAEAQFGIHASGLNAAMARQVTSDQVTNEVLRASVATIQRTDGFWNDEVEVRPLGSLLLVGPQDSPLVQAAREAARAGLDCRVLDRREAVELVEVLKDTDFDRALFTASDGVVDIHALLWRYLRCAQAGGGHLVVGARVEAVECDEGRVRAVRTSRGRVRCRVLVNAAGAWANRLATLAGLGGIAMQPFRRHLITTPPLPFVRPQWPFVWDTVHEYYFRPEVGGLLLSPGDQDPSEPGPVQRDPRALETLGEKLARHCPALAGIPVSHWWAGLRTITRDARFAVGWDTRLSGFFWVAGLGGHGMTASCAVGEFAADLIAGYTVEPGWRSAMDPMRLL